MRRSFTMENFWDLGKRKRTDAANTNALSMESKYESTKIISRFPRRGKMDDKDSLNNLLLGVLLVAIVIGLSLIYMMTHPEQTETLKAEPIVKEQSAEPIVKKTVGGHEKVKVTVAEPEEKKPTLSDEDIMAIVAECEAGNQEIIGRVGVIATILNRCDYYGETVETVVYKPNQYAFDKDVVPSEESYLAVKIALRERDLFPRTMMWFLPSGYSKYGEPYLKIQDHYFNCLSESEETN